MATTTPGTAQTSPGESGQAWLSPGLVTALCGATYRDVDVAPATPMLLIQKDIRRVGFLVIRKAGMMSYPRIGPMGDVADFGIPEDTTVWVRTFVLTDWLSLITAEWYTYSTNGGTVRVFEFKRPTLR